MSPGGWSQTRRNRAGKARTFFDVVNWEMLVAPGVIGCRDGSLIAGWQVTGIDTETMEEVEIEARLDQLAEGLSGLGDGDALRLVRKRRKWKRPGRWEHPHSVGGEGPAVKLSGEPDNGGSPADQSNGGSPADQSYGGDHTGPADDSALAALFLEQDAILSASGYLWTDTITLYYHRSNASDGFHAASGGLSAVAIGGKPAAGKPGGKPAVPQASTVPVAIEAFEAFEADCRDIENRLGGVLGLSRLGPVTMDANWTGCALTASLFGLLGLPERPVHIDPDQLPVPIDRLIGIDVEQPDRHRPGRIGDRPAALMALEGFRDSAGEGVRTGRLAQLQSQPQEFTWVLAYGALSANTMRQKTRVLQRFWRQSAADIKADIIGENEGRRGRYEDTVVEKLEDTIERVSSGETGYGMSATWFLVTGEEGKPDASIADAVRDLGSVPTAAGLGMRRETVNFVPALLSMLPGHEGLDARAFAISARNVTGLMPLRSIWQGEPTCPSPLMPPATPALLRARAQTGELMNFNLHCGDLGHGLVFGPTGAGKSVLLGLLAAAFLRYPDAQVFYFDRQRSIAHACAALGGVFMEPGTDGPAGIAPLAHMHELGKGWATDWLTTLVRLRGIEPDTEMRAELHKAIDSTWKLETQPDINSILTYVQVKELRNALAIFANDGTYADLFSQDLLFKNGGFAADQSHGAASLLACGGSPANHNGHEMPEKGNPQDPTDDQRTAGDSEGETHDTRQAAFSVFETHAMMEAPEIVRVLSLDYIFAQVQRRFDGRPTLVVFDEAWSFFSHDLFIQRIRSWLKEGRKNNVGVVMATQSLTDAIRSQLTADLMESCPTKIYLPNAAAESRAAAQHYEALGLSAPEIEQIARMRTKRDYYITQPQGRRVLSFPLGHLGLSIIGRTSAMDSRRAAQKRNNRGGRPHPDFWKEGLDDAFDKMGAAEERRQSRRERQETSRERQDPAAKPVAKRDDASQEAVE